MTVRLLQGDCRELLKTLPDESVHLCMTSPPYFALRSYLPDGHPDKGKDIGLKSSVEAYVAELVAVFREVRRVLRDDGTLWLNLGDSYAANRTYQVTDNKHRDVGNNGAMRVPDGLKPKDLIGVPWRAAFALQADGWWLRRDIIWCLSGGTKVYARTQKGDMPMTLKDLYRLEPATVKLWNGETWTQLLGMSRSVRAADELELTLRSGEKIACTPTHQFPTERGLLRSDELVVGDRLTQVELPQPGRVLDSVHVSEDAAWFCGLYLAEGSRDDDCIRIHGHVKETERLARVSAIVRSYGGSLTTRTTGNGLTIHIHSRLLYALIDNFIGGTNAKTKHLKVRCWQYSNAFLHSLLQGYLSGDGHYDQKNRRWRLAFTRNDALASDLRTMASRLGAHLVLNQRSVAYNGGRAPTYRGELRLERSGHRNQRHPNEVVAIAKARCRYVYDLGVADEPHVFALASGVLTHNSKPNPMPESCTDRATSAHEYVLMFSKAPRYFYDAEAVKEPNTEGTIARLASGPITSPGGGPKTQSNRNDGGSELMASANGRNMRSVWTIPTSAFPFAHFATYPPALVERCIKAGTSEKGCCGTCGSPWRRVVERGSTTKQTFAGSNGQQEHPPGVSHRLVPIARTTTGWQPTCSCPPHDPVPCVVLDPFSGSGTTGLVAERLGRDSILLELSEAYCRMARKRIVGDAPLFNVVDVVPASGGTTDTAVPLGAG